MPNRFLSEEPAKPKGKDSLFLWTIFLLFLAALVFACWLGSFYVFGHPEQARSYRILKKLGKIAPPTRFVVTKAPPGEFLEAQRLFERYSKYTALQMQRENELLFRNYLRNFAETKKLVPYLTGKFVILRAYELQKNDLIGGGVVALTQSADFPQMLAEVIYPAAKENVPDMLALLQPGLELRMQRTLDLSAVIQVSHALDGRLQVTVVPLLYGSYALKNGTGMFSLEPPQSVNVWAGFPVVRGEEVRSVMRENLRRHSQSKGAQVASNEPKGEIVRVDGVPSVESGDAVSLAGPPSGEPSAVLPNKPADNKPADKGTGIEGATEVATVPQVEAVSKEATKDPAKTKGESKVETLSRAVPEWMGKAEKILAGGNAGTAATPGVGGKKPETTSPASGGVIGAGSDKTSKGAPPTASGAAAVKVPAKQETSSKPESAGALASAKTSPPSQEPPRAPAPKPVSAAPAPQPAAPISSNPNGVPLKPFVASAPAPSTTQPTGTWKTYGAGRQPSGKSVTAEQATSLQGRNDGAPLYLHGRFTVTAAGNNRAVLRQAPTADGKSQPRVIVEYPAGAVPPKQGASVAKDDGRGFEIREVRRTPDGQVNIYVREVGGF